MTEGQSEKTRVAVLGLHDTGKSNFVGALFLALEAPDVETTLSLADYAGKRQYVNKLAKAIREGEQIGRTETQDEGNFEADLIDGMGNVFGFNIPDWSGEALERALLKRRMRTDLSETFSEVQGVLLFLHPEAVFELKEIETVSQWLEAVEAAGGTIGEIKKADKEVHWNNGLASTDLKMVDALQEVIKIAPPGLRVAVVISAWDLAEKDELDPERWLAKRFPLLDEFLRSNERSAIRSAVFGVSARGRPDAKMDREFLATKAAKRTRVVGQGAREHDMTAPIAWLRG